jgi:hypothetical protein
MLPRFSKIRQIQYFRRKKPDQPVTHMHESDMGDPCVPAIEFDEVKKFLADSPETKEKSRAMCSSMTICPSQTCDMFDLCKAVSSLTEAKFKSVNHTL